MTNRTMTRNEFRDEWMKTQEEIAEFVHLGMELQARHKRLYEGVLGEPAPRFETRLLWDEDGNTSEAA